MPIDRSTSNFSAELFCLGTSKDASPTNTTNATSSAKTTSTAKITSTASNTTASRTSRTNSTSSSTSITSTAKATGTAETINSTSTTNTTNTTNVAITSNNTSTSNSARTTNTTYATNAAITSNNTSTSSSTNVTCTAKTTSTTIATFTLSDGVEAISERSTLQCKHFLMQARNSFMQWTEVHSSCTGDNPKHKITYWEICSTALSIVIRAIAVCINIKLAIDYYYQGHCNYFTWTIICIVIPIIVTTFIHANMCYRDGKFNGNGYKTLKTLGLILISSCFLRYWNSLVYAIKCKRAEHQGDKSTQLRYYKLNIREESDVAFIRLFECFLEAAPQKILQISIVLGHFVKMTNTQILAITSYFGSMAWCLAAYHRYNRYSQSDKHNITWSGIILQLCWHFCISVSRTLCIALLASIFPLWILIASLCHALLFGVVSFIVERPKFSHLCLLNFLFCLVLGIVYIFTFISVRDTPTRYKYMLYYIICSIENIICIILFILYASNDLISITFLFYPLCTMTLTFYYIGIVFMILYYLYYHPRITARSLSTPTMKHSRTREHNIPPI